MTNKYIYFVANWKMFGNLRSLYLLNKVITFTKKYKRNKFKLIYCPPNTLISPLKDKLKSSSIDIGAQNCHESENFGANTGYVNSKMLKSVGAKYIILGHSENRQDGDSDKLINLKIKSAIKAGLKIIFCIGETLKEKKNKKTKRVLTNQIQKGLNLIKNKSDIIIAYEPVWSIGTGMIAKTEDLTKCVAFIKSKFSKKSPKILYGGSVNANNIEQLKNVSNIDGFLIGGASQDPKKFIDIIKKTYI